MVLWFAVWAIWAMSHTVDAEAVAAEIPAEPALAQSVSGHPHLSGHPPVED